MNQINQLNNARFRPGPGITLGSFTSEGHVRWQTPSMFGYHAAVLQGKAGGSTRLNYALPIWVKGMNRLHLSGWMQADRSMQAKLMLRYQLQDGTEVKSEQQMISLDCRNQWKYQVREIPVEAEQLRLSLQLDLPGRVELRSPQVFFWW